MKAWSGRISRIRRPLFHCDLIPRNVDCRAKDFHGESYYDIPALAADPRFRDSMRLVHRYSLLPFMTPMQFFYPRVVLEFYHTMTSRGVSNPMQLQFSIDGRPGLLRASDITVALGLPIVLANSIDFCQWPHPSPREMVRSLSRNTTAGSILVQRQLPPHMLLTDHILRSNLFPLQHYLQRRGAILEALYRIFEGFWFNQAELIMTALLYFEEKVHRKGLTRAETIPLLMPRLLCHVLEHLGFPEEPHIERRQSCAMIISHERTLSMQRSFLFRQQEDVMDDYAEDLPRDEQPVPVVEVKGTSVPDSSPPVPPPTASAPLETAGPSSKSQQPSEHIPVTSRDFLAVMDAVRAFVATSASFAASHTVLAEQMARAEVALAQNQAILLQIQSHLGLPPVTVTSPIQPTTHE